MGMNDYEISCVEFDRSVLTAILRAVSPAPHKAADDILNTFPSFQHATRADHKALAEVIGNAGARLLRTIPDAVASMTRETACLLYTSPSPRDLSTSRMPSSA